MSIAVCKHCNHTISKDAEICPKCKKPTFSLPEIYSNCRACNEKLLQDQYRQMCSILGNKHVDKGNKWASAFCYIKHIPCPKCGDPKPLMCFWDTLLAEILVFLMVFVGGMVSFMCFMVLAGFSAVSSTPEESIQRKLIAAAFMVLYIGMIFMVNRWRAKGIPDANTGYVLTAL